MLIVLNTARHGIPDSDYSNHYLGRIQVLIIPIILITFLQVVIDIRVPRNFGADEAFSLVTKIHRLIS